MPTPTISPGTGGGPVRRRQPPRGGPRRSPLTFFALVFFLAVPFWVLGAITGAELMPGLPIDALMFVCPGLAGLILSWREHGRAGAAALLARAFDVGRMRSLVWLAPILLLKPALAALAWAAMRLQGTPVPVPQIEIVPALGLCAVFFVGALGEELGWSGYAIDPMQGRWGALRASLMLGAVWAVFHYGALLHAHRSLDWIAWWTLGTVASRVVMVWLYDNAGKSVFAAALFHTTINVSWQLFPVSGSFLDPRLDGLLMAATAVLVVLIWGPRTLTRARRL